MIATLTSDVHADLFPDGGELDEEAASRYEADLATLFEESPEGRTLAAEGLDTGFAGQIVHYLLRYEGVSVAQVTDVEFETVIFEIIPAKMVVEPEAARG
jgi:hypothetical protein